jgi:hypothetical protein
MANIMDFKSPYATCPQVDTQRWEDRKGYKDSVYQLTEKLITGEIDLPFFKKMVAYHKDLFNQE